MAWQHGQPYRLKEWQAQGGCTAVVPGSLMDQAGIHCLHISSEDHHISAQTICHVVISTWEQINKSQSWVLKKESASLAVSLLSLWGLNLGRGCLESACV